MKAPKLFIANGADAKALRKKLRLNQQQFWERVSVTQSGGSRYESGRDLPDAVAVLLHVAHAPEKRAQEMVAYLRQPYTK